MAVPLSYSWRNLLTRRATTALTAGGMALVVFVFAATLMLAEGLRRTLVATGSPDNVVVLRKSSETEVQSSLERSAASVAATRPEIAQDASGALDAAREVVVLFVMPKRTGSSSNVVIRGTERASLGLRPQVRLAQGRLPRPGSTEIMVGESVREKFAGVALGQSLSFGQRSWTVVGVFDAGSTGFASEIWGDAEQLMQAFRRNAYSVVVARLREPGLFESYRAAVEGDPRLQAEVRPERKYYEDQSKALSKFLKVLGVSLTAIFSIGAMLGAMITMFSAVAGRVGEIGALRALGFGRRAILLAFLAEAALLGGLGGAVGLFFAAFLSFLSFSTTNFQTFAELAFRFTLTGEIAAWSMGFALFMGLAGGVLPALRAARMNIVEALRSG
ncbi:Macrolide export ATP-binding/permease protein MacB [Fundidesulfovibrio magnetotacticus]|uniref:Macrolide export ATP-binding/permease protein MacB n=1 Tax=Fundidesulfovibrio magnetotacticus TaxID=2730080 RepID=A0A6V8LS90_9BACT|nr:ABC transporter permease [Fundidesulfovibrio magnetotacticus]GFK93840.1 Macrolide export ATP-binding/permease protein MacB [Fundidesulfovibrio magnetotacticus]